MSSKHILVDYKIRGCLHLSYIELAHLLYQIMIEAVKTTEMVIVNSSCNILGEDGKSPLGFSNILSLNTSHFTLHNYYDRKTLSMDVYTCGETDPQIIVDFFERKVTALLLKDFQGQKPSLKQTNFQKITRKF